MNHSMAERDKSHILAHLFGNEWVCERCHMCTCHSNHKLIVMCESIDGRVKIKEETK